MPESILNALIDESVNLQQVPNFMQLRSEAQLVTHGNFSFFFCWLKNVDHSTSSQLDTGFVESFLLFRFTKK